MRVQVSVSQYCADGGVMNGLDVLFLYDSLRQRSVRPMRHVPADRLGEAKQDTAISFDSLLAEFGSHIIE